MTADTVLRRESPSAGAAPRLDGVGLAHFAKSLRMLCEQNRMRILCLLMQGERGVCDLADCLSLPQNLVSHHLGVLREMGLVSPCRDQRDARCVHYAVNRTALAHLNELYVSFFAPERVRPWHPECCSADKCCPACHTTRRKEVMSP